MSTPTDQAPPRPHVSTRKRDPRRDPQPGDRLEQGGIVWTVLEADGSVVSWRVEGMDEAHHCSREHWPRTTRARQVLTHRDPKPENMLTDRVHRALYALRDYTHGEPHESLCQRSRLTHGSWQRAVGDLKRGGLVVVSIERQGRTVRACYSLTPEGTRLASTLTQPTSQPTTQPNPSVGSVDAAHLGPVGCSSSSSSLLKPKAEEKKEERPTQPTLAAHDAAHAAQPTDAAALLAPILDTLRLLMEPIARMLEEQGKTQAALAATLERIAYALPGAPLAPCPCGSPREAKVNRTTGEHYVACLKGKACPTKQEARGEQPKASPMRVASARAAILAVDQRTKADIEAERRGIRPRPAAAS